MKLTGFSKLIIFLLFLALVLFGLKASGLLDNLISKGNDVVEQVEETVEEAKETTTKVSTSSFDYDPIRPVNGKLKGVVELGAAGFNSFIVEIDRDKDWNLEKAEWGNSLVLDGLANDEDVRIGLKRYISNILDYGVSGQDIHFVVSSGAQMADNTAKIISALKSLGYVVNAVTPEQEGEYALKCVMPKPFADNSFVVDIGSGNTKISWKEGGRINALESFGSKYYLENTADSKVYDDVVSKIKQIPPSKRQTCFLIGGIPFTLAKEVRNGEERFTVLPAPSAYNLEGAKNEAGLNIYQAIVEASGTDQFVFDWDANFTIGFLLDLPY